jgi:hypothetical protein
MRCPRRRTLHAALFFWDVYREPSILTGELPEESVQSRFLRAGHLVNLKVSAGLNEEIYSTRSAYSDRQEDDGVRPIRIYLTIIPYLHSGVVHSGHESL